MTSSDKKSIHVMHLIGSLKVGGAEKVVCELMKGFRATSTRATVMALADGPLRKELIQLGIEVIIQPFAWATAPFWLLRTAWELRHRSIDLLHTHLFTTDQLGRLAGKFAGIPVVSTLHAPSTWKRSQKLKDRLKRRADMFTARHACNALIAISTGVKNFQTRYGALPLEKVCVIGNPVHTDRFQRDPGTRTHIRDLYGLDEHDTVLINVASLKPIKGQEYLLRAFAQLAKTRNGLKLLLVGDGPSMGELKNLSTELGITRQVVFCGTRHDVPAHLGAADIFVMSSLSEGISMAMLEAMAASLPIVATAVGGNVDLIQNWQTGLLTTSQDHDALASAIASLLENPVKAQAMGERAAGFVRAHYDAPCIARRYEDLYRAVLNHGQCGCACLGERP